MRTSAIRQLVGLVGLLAFGCGRGPGRNDAGSDDAAATTDGLATDAPGTDVPAASVPTIDAVLECGTRGTAGGLSSPGSDPSDYLQAHPLDTTVFPDALCNDGTPAVVYYRPARDAADRNRWVIQLQGGGSCGSPDECAKRWCSVDTAFGMQGMTSTVAPPDGIDGEGILQDDEPRNPWRNWNHVFVRYCSSDTWSGTARDVVVEAHHPVRTTETVRYRVHFLGARIFDAAIATLRQDGVPALRWTAGGASSDMPDLDDAAEVVLAGASGGGAGTISNLDRLAALLRANNTACADGGACPLVVRGLIDSIVGLSLETLDHTTSTACAANGLCSYEQLYRAIYQGGSFALWGGRPEESCDSWHRANMPGTEWKCADNGHVVRNHITTPFFVRMGLTDSLISSGQIDGGYSIPGQGPLTLMSWAERLHDELLAMADIQTTADERAAVPVPGVFGPLCSKHETLRCDDATFDTNVTQNGTTSALFDVWQRWTTGPASVVSSAQGDAMCHMTCNDGL